MPPIFQLCLFLVSGWVNYVQFVWYWNVFVFTKPFNPVLCIDNIMSSNVQCLVVDLCSDLLDETLKAVGPCWSTWGVCRGGKQNLTGCKHGSPSLPPPGWQRSVAGAAFRSGAWGTSRQCVRQQYRNRLPTGVYSSECTEVVKFLFSPSLPPPWRQRAVARAAFRSGAWGTSRQGVRQQYRNRLPTGVYSSECTEVVKFLFSPSLRPPGWQRAVAGAAFRSGAWGTSRQFVRQQYRNRLPTWVYSSECTEVVKFLFSPSLRPPGWQRAVAGAVFRSGAWGTSRQCVRQQYRNRLPTGRGLPQWMYGGCKVLVLSLPPSSLTAKGCGQSCVPVWRMRHK